MTDAEDPRGPGGRSDATLESLEADLLGSAPSLTRLQVCEQADVPLMVAEELWRLLGFAHLADDEVAFTEIDVEALRLSHELMTLGVLNGDSQAALVRTWGRSFARLAEWQTEVLADVAHGESDTGAALVAISRETVPRIEVLQSYIWRRHLATASRRMLTRELGGGSEPAAGESASLQAVVFCDIVGYTSRSKELDEHELVAWLEGFESACADLALEHGGRIIKNIGDEVLLVCDAVEGALDCALAMTSRGADDEDAFPEVRAGVAFGRVVSRLGDVFGPTVNIASRLTSVARPGTVVIDEGARDALEAVTGERPDDGARSAYSLSRIRQVSVKGYAKLRAWRVRPS